MQKFNYSEMKRKTAGERFKEQHEKEKQKAQDEVNSIIYSDASTRAYVEGSGTSGKDSVADAEKAIKDELDEVDQKKQSESQVSDSDKKITLDSYESEHSYNDTMSDDSDFKSSSFSEGDVPVYEPDEEGVHSNDIHVKETFDYNPSPQVKVPADRTRAAQAKDKGDISMSTVREFPTELAQRIKKLFPAARTMGEALAAYVYLKEGEPEDIRISSEIASVAKSYIGDTVTPKDVQEELMKELLRMREMNNKAMRKLNSIELGVSYALFDRLGFRKLETLSPGQLNFLETGIADLIQQLEKQSELKQNRDLQKSGRPIR